MRYIHQNPVKAGLAKTAKECEYNSWGNDYLGLGRIHVCHTEPVIRRYGLAELTAWVDMPIQEKYKYVDINERRVIPDTEVRDIIVNTCGLRSIADFQFASKKKDIIREVMVSTGARPRQLSRITLMNYETIRNIAKIL